MQLIVNVTQNWGIGMENQLLVTISDDLKRFRRMTTGKTVILGRSTLATFPGGKPLKGRCNLVLSRQAGLSIEGAEVIGGIPALLARIQSLPPDEVMVIGGASVYETLLDYCDTAHITKTLCTPPADRFFPNLDELENWSVTEESEVFEENGIQFRYLTYKNSNPIPLQG